MALIVQKFGGTSVGNLERIGLVADKILKTRQEGHDVVVVVSAIAGETDRLLQMASQISSRPDPRELDVLLSTGEQVSMALLSMALLTRGCQSRSYTGAQVPIYTDNVHNKARILGIESAHIQSDLRAGKVVIVAGFQGIDVAGNLTTLGRGGSDTTAVALAAALDADECQIYTDVDGVYTIDPQLYTGASKMTEVTVAEMLEMASSGAKVIQHRAVEHASHHRVPVRVLSTFQEGSGTKVVQDYADLQRSAISGIAFNRDEVRCTISGLSDGDLSVSVILQSLAKAHVEIDMIHALYHGSMDLAFTFHKRDYFQVQQVLSELPLSQAQKTEYDLQVAKIALIGVGLRSHAGVTAQVFEILERSGIAIQLASTSEIRVCVIIQERDLELASVVLHEAFELGVSPSEEVKEGCL